MYLVSSGYDFPKFEGKINISKL